MGLCSRARARHPASTTCSCTSPLSSSARAPAPAPAPAPSLFSSFSSRPTTSDPASCSSALRRMLSTGRGLLYCSGGSTDDSCGGATGVFGGVARSDGSEEKRQVQARMCAEARAPPPAARSEWEVSVGRSAAASACRSPPRASATRAAATAAAPAAAAPAAAAPPSRGGTRTHTGLPTHSRAEKRSQRCPADTAADPPLLSQRGPLRGGPPQAAPFPPLGWEETPFLERVRPPWRRRVAAGPTPCTAPRFSFCSVLPGPPAAAAALPRL